MTAPDAVIVGSGPNGLAAALTLARAGLSVHVFEGAATAGGGCRTQEITLPGYQHDLCSAVHPLAAASPFFQGTDLAAGGVTLLTPEVAFAHPLDGGRAAAVAGSVQQTALGLGADCGAYQRLLGPLVRDAEFILPAFLAPLRSVPPHPAAVARFALQGLLPASRLARRFATDEAKALVAGVSAHAILPLDAPVTGGYGLMFAIIAHSVGWPVVEGGSARITDAMAGELASLGGQITTGRWIGRLADLPAARATLLDITPRQFIALVGDALPSRYARALQRFSVRAGNLQGRLGAQRCRCPGRPMRAGRRDLCIWAAPSLRLPAARLTWRPAGTPTARFASWHSPASWMSPVRLPGSTRCGVTAMCRPAPRWT